MTTATAFPGFIFKHCDGQSQILTGHSTGTSRAEEINTYFTQPKMYKLVNKMLQCDSDM